jgi:hypothetical protein
MRRVAVAIGIGIAGSAALIALYLGIVTLAQGSEHALQLLWDDRLFVGAISVGFGAQAGMFAYVRLLQHAIARGSVALTGAGTATSSVSMVACCAHHVTDILPILGISGAAALLVEFRTPLMILGVATNAAGVAVMLRAALRTMVLARTWGPAPAS